jgi:hypothetical protein
MNYKFVDDEDNLFSIDFDKSISCRTEEHRKKEERIFVLTIDNNYCSYHLVYADELKADEVFSKINEIIKSCWIDDYEKPPVPAPRKDRMGIIDKEKVIKQTYITKYICFY